MKAVFAFVFSLLVASAAFAQVGDVGEMIFRSKDLRFLTEGCTLAYTIKNRHLYCASESSSSATTPNGASVRITYFEEEITVTAGETLSVGVNSFPAGSMVLRCLTRTTQAVDGGYLVGTDGAESLFATVDDGSEDGTSLADQYFVGQAPIYADEPVRITPPNESTFGSTGKVRVACLYYLFTAPTR